MKLFCVFVSLLLVAMATSCSSSENFEEKNIPSEEATIESMKFLSPKDCLSLKSTRSPEATDNLYTVETENLTSHIRWFFTIKFNIASKKQNCNNGFGLCFMKPIKYNEQVISGFEIDELNEHEVETLLKMDMSSGRIYTELLLAEPIDETVMPEFEIEDDVLGLCDSGEEFIAVQGSYRFDKTLGPNGGYIIDIDF